MGVADSAYYESFKHLNAKIIKPSVEEMNKTSNIAVTPETRKRGRTVTDIRFRIVENPQLAILDIHDGGAVRNGAVYAQLRDLGVSDRLARQWIGEHGEDYVREKLSCVAGQGAVKSPVHYLTAALRDDYKAEVPVAGAGLSERATRLAKVRDALAARSTTQRDADRRLFTSTLEGAAARADFERHGWMSPLNATAIFEFWARVGAD